MFKDHVFNWLKSNQKVFIYASFLFLFSWYIHPIIKESRNKNNCAFNIALLGLKESRIERDNVKKKLANKLRLINADYKDVYRFCGFYKSSEDSISIYGDIDAKIRGVIRTQEQGFRGY